MLIFLWQLSLGKYAQNAVFALGMIPAVVFNIKQLSPDLVTVPALATFFTSMFLHGGWMHLIGNMLYLWIFGNNVEDAMGHKRFILFYLICGVAAALTQAIPNPDSVIPMIGASGAISGVLGAYWLLYPHARVLIVIPIGFYLHTTRIKAGWVLGFWFILQIVSSIMSADQQGGVAWGAHIGGFVAGIALIPFFKYRHVRLFTPARGNYR
ncbi:MAG: rhomboid family intramembrane serine protease [Gammaproteobacteria bacterium]|nr:rhomboid family intramembrane serine protease [Gammaproteobacteria bacterium]